MNNLARTLSLVALLLLGPSYAAAQGVRVESKAAPTPAQTFTSLEARFSIDLPQQISAFGPLTGNTPKGRVTLGDSYSWRLPDALYQVGYLDTTLAPNFAGDGKAFIDSVTAEAIAAAAKKNGKLLSNTEVSLAGNYGRDVRIEYPDFMLISRAYFVNQRMYQVAAVVKKDAKLQEAVVKTLDTFRVLTPAEVEAAQQRKEAEATPSPLPQEPVAKRPKSDTEDEGLRGRVKTVFTESEDLSGTRTVQKRKPSSMDYYDERGNLTKRELYDYKGNLSDIAVYGYLDGERVSKFNTIEQEYNPPPMLVAPAPGEAKPKYDPRYSYKFKFKYDDAGRLVEKVWYGNNGKLWLRYVYNFSGNQKEELVYSADGSLNQRYLYSLDDKGNEIAETIFETKDNSVRSKYTYSYEFDAKGNWTKRVSSKWESKDGKEGYQPDDIYYRTIAYY